ncbi:hypothetical protein VTP01DRAFT_5109 [Rhizomucor pusillus]|uniref:uncharacterized protein n=1 Tax=Rhizomucor pusillus TaxID=4840 RepID=UPI00374232A1
MTTVPPHYSDRYVNQRYNKALHIVQHLPPSSTFQPTRDQKLELYALYKQASSGNVNTQRPGIFDVVGRAKWDAWKKLEGMSSLEAKHRYVEVLMRVSMEAYKKPASRSQAQQIIQALNSMHPAEDTESSDDEYDGTSTGIDERDGSSVGSAEAEERAYLLEIQHDSRTHAMRPQPPISPASSVSTKRQQKFVTTTTTTNTSNYRTLTPNRRAPSSASNMRRMSRASSVATVHTAAEFLRPESSASRGRMTRYAATTPREALFDENFDPNMNPWAQHPLVDNTRRYHLDDGRSSDEDEDDLKPSSIVQLPSPVVSSSHAVQALRSPPYNQRASSTTSSMTATGPSVSRNENPLLTEQQYTSVVALGPATKKALDTLQAEIVALNERIDGLRQELLERKRMDRQRDSKEKDLQGRPGGDGGGWKWLVRTAIRHAAVNMFMTIIVVLLLYQRNSPVASVILGQIRKVWQRSRAS